MKEWLKRWARAALRPVAGRLAGVLRPELEAIRLRAAVAHAQDAQSYMQSCGRDVRIAPGLRVSDARSVALGNGVCIGDDAWLDSAGGLTVGDGARLGRNVSVLTVDRQPGAPSLPRAVHIGRAACVGDRTCLLPGASVGDGAVVSPGAIVSGDVPAAESAAPVADGAPHGDDPRTGLFFVASTGRSGSLSICEALSQHPRIVCRHEPRPQMIRLATEWAHGARARVGIENELAALFCESSVFPEDRRCGESDQKYSHLIEPLARRLPACRFVWLIRDGRDVVASTFGQEWFPRAERPGDPVSNELYDRWLYYRLNGADCGEFSRDAWDRLPLFAKNCWHWSFVNRSIEGAFQSLPETRCFRVRLEELSENLGALFRFLGEFEMPAEVRRRNQATYAVKRWRQWDEEERAAFEQWCGAEMDRWYSGWRDAWIAT